jgi:hypothetical protein
LSGGNKRLEGEKFILMGPGRWGSSNIDLGIKVSYADIYNTSMLIEIAVARNGITPELSYGTHFFQDLIESNIYPWRSIQITPASFLIINSSIKLRINWPHFYLKIISMPTISR